jgi:hypothetical protein
MSGVKVLQMHSFSCMVWSVTHTTSVLQAAREGPAHVSALASSAQPVSPQPYIPPGPSHPCALGNLPGHVLEGKVVHGLGSGAQPGHACCLHRLAELLILRQEAIPRVNSCGTIRLANLWVGGWVGWGAQAGVAL